MIRTTIVSLALVALSGCVTAGHAPVAPITASASTSVAAAKQDEIAAPGMEILGIAELSDAMARGDTTSEAITRNYLSRIAAIDDSGPKINAVLALMPDAIEQARALDAERAAGQMRGPLHGIPILIKDNIEAAGPVPTTAGSLALADNVTGRDAPLVARLKAAGAIILGKTNLSEWANFRSSDSTSGWSAVGGLTRNPHVLDRSACGSSAGSGAAVAAGLAAGAIGTETSGSIICPSGTNGIVGFKPTVGLVSRTHVVPISHNQDTAGPMTRNVRDAAMMLTALAGTDPADPATIEATARAIDYAAALDADWLAGKRIGFLRSAAGDRPAVIAIAEDALATMRLRGATIIDVELDEDAFAGFGEASGKVIYADFKADLETYLATLPGDGMPRTLTELIAYNASTPAETRWFGQDRMERAMEASPPESAEYRQALAKMVDTAGRLGIDALMREHDLDILVAVSNGPAWSIDLANGDNFQGPSFSSTPARAGYPHLTVPGGTILNLPIGISFIGGKWEDAKVLSAGYAFEQARPRRVLPRYLRTVDVPAEE